VYVDVFISFSAVFTCDAMALLLIASQCRVAISLIVLLALTFCVVFRCPVSSIHCTCYCCVKQTDKPLAVGFGISQPEHVSAVGELADAAVCGSAIMNAIDQVGISHVLHVFIYEHLYSSYACGHIAHMSVLQCCSMYSSTNVMYCFIACKCVQSGQHTSLCI
jgi:Tryptophan synthase alpha chain